MQNYNFFITYALTGGFFYELLTGTHNHQLLTGVAQPVSVNVEKVAIKRKNGSFVLKERLFRFERTAYSMRKNGSFHGKERLKVQTRGLAVGFRTGIA